MVFKVDKDDAMRLVVIGGGTGLSSILRGLKMYTNNITAVVTVADDGGSSGMLRNDYGILPPGDIRNCIMALADTEPIMEQLMQYRFTDGSLKGQNFGNLLLTALHDISGGTVNAIRDISNVLAVTGKVLPMTLEDVVLGAELEDGTVIKGESVIPVRQFEAKSNIRRVFLEPAHCRALPETLEAIVNADVVILGPGSLYTSLIPNLLVRDISEALIATEAQVVFATNIMSQKGETIGYKLSDHVRAVSEHIGAQVIDYIVANDGPIPSAVMDRYAERGEQPLEIDRENFQEEDIALITADLVKINQNGMVRHDADKFTQVICDLPITRIWRN